MNCFNTVKIGKTIYKICKEVTEDTRTVIWLLHGTNIKTLIFDNRLATWMLFSGVMGYGKCVDPIFDNR